MKIQLNNSSINDNYLTHSASTTPFRSDTEKINTIFNMMNNQDYAYKNNVVSSNFEHVYTSPIEKKKEITLFENVLQSRLIEELTALKKQDDTIKKHEQVHYSVARQYSELPTFQYQKGSDGNRYVVKGEVNFKMISSDDSPDAAIKKMQQIYLAALAPADPSTDDLTLAIQAIHSITDLRLQLFMEKLQPHLL